MTTTKTKCTKTNDSAVDITPARSFSSDWQLTKHKVVQRGKKILETGQWTDCKFIVGQEPNQQIIEAHKLILAMSSPVFEAMFFGEMIEKNDTIPVTDVQPETFEALLEYIYTDNIKLGSLDLVCELNYCANKYMLPFLDEECTKFVLSNLSPENVCRAYEFTKLLNKPVMMETCLQVIRTKTDIILKEPSFEEIELETFITILEQEELRIDSEIDLLSAAERWAKAECVRKNLDPEDGESMRSVLGNALKKIRFLSLTSQEFAKSPANSLLFKENETITILWNISSGKLKFPMPDGFSTNMQKRCMKRNTSMFLSLTNTNKTSGTDGLNEIPCGDQILKIVALENYSLKMILTEGDEVRKGQKLEHYCHRFKFERRTFDEDTTWIESFAVNCNIGLIGIQVPSQIRNDVSCYTENLIVEVIKVHGIDSRRDIGLATIDFTAEVNTRALIRLTFEKPVFIERGMTYQFRISFGSTGCYPSFPCRDRLSHNKVSFKFGNTDSNIADLIWSIIYTPLA